MKRVIINGVFYISLIMGLYGPTYGSQQQVGEIPRPNADLYQADKDEEIDEFGPEEPNSYPSLVVNWGITGLQNAPGNMQLSWWRSRILTGGLFYNIPISTSRFMVNVGINFSNVDYVWNKDKKYSLVMDQSRKKVVLKKPETIVPDGAQIIRSMLSVNAMDFVGEFCFNANKEEPQEGFFVALGGYIGFQYAPSMTINYKEEDESKAVIHEETFNCNRYRYGVQGKLGWSRFGLFYTQSLSSLFGSNNGVSEKTIMPWSVGVCVNIL